MRSSPIQKPHKKPQTRANTKDDYDVIRHICAILVISNMLEMLCVSSKTRWTIEWALADVVIKNSRVNIFFTYHGRMKDFVIDVEFMGRPFPVLTKINNEQRPRTNSFGPQANDTLVKHYNFLNEDLCTLSQIIIVHST